MVSQILWTPQRTITLAMPVACLIGDPPLSVPLQTLPSGLAVTRPDLLRAAPSRRLATSRLAWRHTSAVLLSRARRAPAPDSLLIARRSPRPLPRAVVASLASVPALPPPVPATGLLSSAARPGTPLGDLRCVIAHDGDDAGQLAALERTVARLLWFPRAPRVRQALAERARMADTTIEEVKLQELRAAVFLVLAERDRPQRHRFGRAWLTDADGHQAEVVPERLPPDLFLRWFADEAHKAAAASLLEGAYPPTPDDSGDTTWSRTIPRHDASEAGGGAGDAARSIASDPLLLVLRREHETEIRQRWRLVLSRATVRQRQLLDALAEAHPHEPAATIADAARRLGMAPSTARVQWKRLADRLRRQEIPAHDHAP